MPDFEICNVYVTEGKSFVNDSASFCRFARYEPTYVKGSETMQEMMMMHGYCSGFTGFLVR